MSWLRRLAWWVVGLLSLWAVAWLAVPPLVKWQGERRLSDLLGRQVTLGGVGFDPWALRLSVDDIAIAAAAGAKPATPQLRVAHLRIDFDARSLLRLAPVVEALQIDAPRLRIARTAAGQYDIDDVLQRLAPNPDATPRGTPRFALFNVELRDGEFLFDDRPVQREHELTALTLSLPFVSSLPSQVDVKVEPRLSFTLNGAAYDSGAQAVPFASSRSGALTLRVASLDLAPYVDYFPETLPVRVRRGRVNGDLTLDFAAPEHAEPRVSLRGAIGASELSLTEQGGAPLLDIEKLALTLTDVQPLARKVLLGALRLDGPELHLARDASGVLNLARLTNPKASATAATAAPDEAAPAATAWQLSLESCDVAGARLLWNDAAVQPAAAFVLGDMTLSSRQLRLPFVAPAPFSLAATLKPQGSVTATLAKLALQGQASDTAAAVEVSISDLSLAALAPYFNASTHAQVAGTGAVHAKVEWAAATPERPSRVAATIDDLALAGLRLSLPSAEKGGRSDDLVAVQRVQVAGAEVDLASAKVAVASLKLQRPELHLDRTADGAWNVSRLISATPIDQEARAGVRGVTGQAWQVELKDFLLDDGRLQLHDAAPAAARSAAPPEVVRIDVDQLRVAVQGMQLHGSRLQSKPRVKLAARIVPEADKDSGRAFRPGRVDWDGRVGVEPLAVRGSARIEHFPVHAVQAYVSHDLGLRLAHAEAGFRGDVALQQSGDAAPSGDIAGDLLLSDLLLLARPGTAQRNSDDRELLSWQSFAVNGMNLTLRPGALPKLVIADATLSDFFARLILAEDGALNLRDVAPRPAAGAASAPLGAAAVPAASAASAAPGPPPPAGAGQLPVVLDLGGLKFVDGRVAFTDRFVTPNYSAALTELNGRIGAFRTGSGEPATLQLSGRAAGTGLLEISGRINPGTVPRELDITARASDIELAPLSTYAGKYAGYAIERGKLSVEVHYRIEPDGKLDASHQVILNQLTFGERVESPTATKLPVLLAVALLKDKDGVIDINLPVGGTVSDPQFSVGAIIWKVIVNLLTKAVTAPFTLLAGGGGHDISVVDFEPGTSLPTPSGATTIDKVAKALADRPALKMTVTGQADPETEREAYQRAVVEQRLLLEQRREQLRTSGKAAQADAAQTIAGADRARLVKAVYQQTELPDKPRNAIGLKADIAPAEMEALLRKHVQASPEAMRELALQRGLAVRDALAATGLASERLFLGVPRLRGGDANEAAWSPQVKLDLSMK